MAGPEDGVPLSSRLQSSKATDDVHAFAVETDIRGKGHKPGTS